MEDLSSLFQKISVGPSDVTPDVPNASPEDPINTFTFDELQEILSKTYVEPNSKYDWTGFGLETHLDETVTVTPTTVFVDGTVLRLDLNGRTYLYDMSSSDDMSDFLDLILELHPEIDQHAPHYISFYGDNMSVMDFFGVSLDNFVIWHTLPILFGDSVEFVWAS